MLSRSPKADKGLAKILATVEDATEEPLPSPEVVVTKRRRSRAGSFTSSDHLGLGLAHLQIKLEDGEEESKDNKDSPWRSPRLMSSGESSPTTLARRISEALSPSVQRRHSAPRVLPPGRPTRVSSPVGSPSSPGQYPGGQYRSNSMPGVPGISGTRKGRLDAGLSPGRKYSSQTDAHNEQLAALLARFKDSPPRQEFDDEFMDNSPPDTPIFGLPDEDSEEDLEQNRRVSKVDSLEDDVFLDKVDEEESGEVIIIDGSSEVEVSPVKADDTSTDGGEEEDEDEDEEVDLDARAEALRQLASQLSEESEDSEFDSGDEKSDIEAYMAAVDAGSSNFVSIELPSQNIDDFSFILLVEKLQKSGKLKQIKRINMDGNELEESSAFKISEILFSCPALEHLDLRWNLVGIEGLQAICNALETNTTLISLNLDGNELGVEGARILGKSLALNSGIQHLELRDNGFGDAGVEALCQGLRGHKSLQLLDLGSNEITAVGAAMLARFLLADYEQIPPVVEGVPTPASPLNVLILNGNEKIGDEGCTAFAKSLIINSSLSSLQLRKCGIRAEGAVGIADVLLNDNSTLLELDFNENMPGVEGELALNDLLMQSEDLYVEWKDPTEESKWDFEQVQFIIDHYGQSEIIANILREYTLEPLIENQKVLGVLEITDVQVANLFLTELLSSKEFTKTGLRMLITILRKGLSAQEADDFDELDGEDLFLAENDESLEEMAPLPRCLGTFLPQILSLLDDDPEPREMSWGETIVPLGDIRLQVVMFINALMDEEGSEVLNGQLMDARVPKRLMELFVEHKHSTILHGAVQAFIRVCMRTDSVRFRLLDEFHLLEWVADHGTAQWALDVSERASYSGFLYAITEDLLKFSFDEGVAIRFARNKRWRCFLDSVDRYRQGFLWDTI